MGKRIEIEAHKLSSRNIKRFDTIVIYPNFYKWVKTQQSKTKGKENVE